MLSPISEQMGLDCIRKVAEQASTELSLVDSVSVSASASCLVLPPDFLQWWTGTSPKLLFDRYGIYHSKRNQMRTKKKKLFLENEILL